MKIGNIKLKNPLILAPMAGVTDHGFRTLCKQYGAGLVCTEMINAIQVIRSHEALELFKGKTKIPLNESIDRLKITKEERPVSIQLFGAEPKTMSQAAYLIEKTADVIDVNLGCPSAKITKGEMGSKLLLYPDNIKKILSEMTSTVKKPVTAKMRLGYSNKNNAVKIAKICEKSGVSAVIVHGRTTNQSYSGTADWNEIIKIKNSLGIPVIGNGDINSPETAVKRLEQVDGIMIGRGAQGNPFIFSRTAHYLKTNELLPKPTQEDKLKSYKEYLKLSGVSKTRGKTQYEKRVNKSFRTQANFFMKGFDGAVDIRRKISGFKTNEELLKYLDSF